MNDIEQELRELLHDRSSEASTPPLAPRQVLKRGRRRQVGTVLIGGVTAILVIVASVAGLRSVLPGHPVVAAAQNDLPERTATIQDFTVTAPAGWTLIDWWQAARAIAFSTTSSPQPTAAVMILNPVLEVANIDPGLDVASACRADATLGSTDAVMVIALGSSNGGAGGTPPPLPVPLDPNAAPRSGPCGEGLYADFSVSSDPSAGTGRYFAFLGFGSDVSDADRQAVLDAYDGLTVADHPQVSASFGTGPGYVMAAGVAQYLPPFGPPMPDQPWMLELSAPRPTLVNSARPGPCLRVIFGAAGGSWCAPLAPTAVPVATGHELGNQVLVAGAVLPDASSVELRVPGQTPVVATLADVPASLRSVNAVASATVPARIFWVVGDAGVEGAQIVQLAADGSELSHEPVVFVALTATAASPIASPANIPSSTTAGATLSP